MKTLFQKYNDFIDFMAGFLKNFSPPTMLLIGYCSYALVGWLLLCLPVAQQVTTSVLDNLFISVSAISTTGLATISPAESYTVFGQLVIIILIQLGGIGYMTFSSFVVMCGKGVLNPNQEDICKSTFSLPKDFSISHFIKRVIQFTLISEFLGGIVLSYLFYQGGESNYIWAGFFHSISAFCTAGFSLFSNSIENYSQSFGVNFVISVLSILGAVGFIVWVDMFMNFSKKRKALTFTSKVILSITFWFLVGGTILFYLIEPSIQSLPPGQKIIQAFFQIMSASTTVGFNSIDISSLSRGSVLLIVALMIFGASPSGTGGGLKSTTFSALVALVKSTLKGRDSIRFRKRDIPEHRLQMATASFVFYISMIFVAVFFLTLLQAEPIELILFEAASALGTVGLSMGLTGSLIPLSKFIIIILMIAGRVGILSFGIALVSHDESIKEEADNDLVL